MQGQAAHTSTGAIAMTAIKPRPVSPLRAYAAQLLSRSAGAPLVEGNLVRILRDAAGNFPEWMQRHRERRAHRSTSSATSSPTTAPAGASPRRWRPRRGPG